MFGKILVSMHVCLSLVFSTWAMVLYTTRVDWTNKKGTPPKPDGAMVSREADYTRLTKEGTRSAAVRWRDGRRLLESHEFWRPIERPWYAKELEFLRTGATNEKPARQIDRDGAGNAIPGDLPRDGNLARIQEELLKKDLLKMGEVKDREGNAYKNRDGEKLKLRSLKAYNDDYEATVTQVTAAMARLQRAAKRDADATNLLKGPRGLHARIDFERIKQDRVRDEYDSVRPLMLKTAVELQNLEQLRTRLEQRLQELRSKGDNLK